MRVLQVAHAFPPRSTAGVEVYTLRLAQALQRQGHDVAVLAAGHDLALPPAAVTERTHHGVRVVEVNSVHHQGTLRSTWEDPALDRAISAALSAFRPHVVHVQHLVNLTAAVPRLARAAGAAVVFTLHDHALSCARDGLRLQADGTLCATVEPAVCAACQADSPYLVPAPQRALAGVARRAGLGRHLHRLHAAAPRVTTAVMGALRRIAPPAAGEDLARGVEERTAAWRAAAESADALVAPTRFVRDVAAASGLDGGRIRVLPLGVVAGPSRPRPAGPRRRFAFVGTLAPHKGAHVLLAAFSGLAGEDLRLDLHGSAAAHPAYAAALREAAGADPRVRFAGPFPEGEQARVLEACDALVLPSVWWETTGMVLLEAIGAGRPVVASRIGGIPEVVEEGRTGLLVSPGDAGALRAALAALASGQRLAEPLEAVPLKTVDAGAAELAALYAEVHGRAVP